MAKLVTCPKCQRPNAVEEEPLDRLSGYHDDGTECPMVACDDEDCRALRSPGGHRNDPERNAAEFEAAYIHWRSHRQYGGCSHGR